MRDILSKASAAVEDVKAHANEIVHNVCGQLSFDFSLQHNKLLLGKRAKSQTELSDIEKQL